MRPRRVRTGRLSAAVRGSEGQRRCAPRDPQTEAGVKVWDEVCGPELARPLGVRITRRQRGPHRPLVHHASVLPPGAVGIRPHRHHVYRNHPGVQLLGSSCLEGYSKQPTNRRVKASLTFESMGHPMATPASPRWSPLPDGFGSLLRAARLRAGLPLTRLAASVGASYGLLYDLEAERRPPSVTMAARLSEALHLDPWEDIVVQATAVDDDTLRSRRGTHHTRPRRARNGTPARAIRVPTP